MSDYSVSVEVKNQFWVVVKTSRIVTVYHCDRREGELFPVWTGNVTNNTLTGRRIPPSNRDYTPFKREELERIVEELRGSLEK